LGDGLSAETGVGLRSQAGRAGPGDRRTGRAGGSEASTRGTRGQAGDWNSASTRRARGQAGDRRSASTRGTRGRAGNRGAFVVELLLISTYVAICYGVFRIFRIPVNQWTLATAALGGIFGLSLLFIVMAYNHPFSSNARIYFAVTPVLPAVKGR